MTMHHFTFDPFGARLEQNHATACIELAKFAAGVKLFEGVQLKPDTRIANGRTSKSPEDPSKPTDGKIAGRYCTVADMKARFGAANVAAMSTGKLTAPDPEAYRRRGEARDALRGELKQIRTRFYPDHDMADVEDGPPAYAVAVEECVAKHFPPPMTAAKLLAELDRYGRKLIFLLKV